MFLCLSVFIISFCLSVFLFSLFLFFWFLSFFLSFCLSGFMSSCLSVFLSVCFHYFCLSDFFIKIYNQNKNLTWCLCFLRMASLTKVLFSKGSWLELTMVSRARSQMSSRLPADMSRQMVPLSSMLRSSNKEWRESVATWGLDQRLPPSSTSSSNLTHLKMLKNDESSWKIFRSIDNNFFGVSNLLLLFLFFNVIAIFLYIPCNIWRQEPGREPTTARL